MSEGSRSAAEYDAMAEDYTGDNDGGAFNALYERPAMLSILGDVTGMRVLDIGCGAGQLSHELIKQGAQTSGIDVSARMIELARRRLGDRIDLRVHDLSEPLPFADSSFDMVVASLVMHYLEHWTPVLSEVRRVLAPQGACVFSTHHPTMDWKLHSPADYFAKKQSTEVWVKGGKPFEVTTWRRPLSAMSTEIRAAGLVIEQIDEPPPHPSLSALNPAIDSYLRTRPHFLFFRLIPLARVDASRELGKRNPTDPNKP
jgi:ubiquinone/menaquinone biosynthesis C-methylase UbiE